MLPEDRTSTFPMPGRFIPPDDQRTALLADKEMGGAALNDPSQGLQVQPWTLTYENGLNLVVTPQSGTPTLLTTVPGITELALTFDQNMRACVAYRKEGVLYLYWFDGLSGQYETLTIGPGYTPRLTLDDKRPSQASNSDILLAYINAGELIYRQQRERFATPRVLRTGLDGATRIRAIGMHRNLRLQIELV